VEVFAVVAFRPGFVLAVDVAA
jgi:hypothetical protein